MPKYFSIGIMVLMLACSPTEMQRMADTIFENDDQLSTEEVVAGLKQALEKGISEGAKELAKPGGYLNSPYKILLPEEGQKIVKKISSVPGFRDFEDNMVERINRAAEDAATKAKPIFVDAIKSMTVRDAWDILKGADNAATRYLEDNTRKQLYQAFRPVIYKSLEEVNAVSLWEKGVNTYNSIPFTSNMNPELDDHVANEALDGLFSMVEKKEAAIRKNPVERTTDLLKKVFGNRD